MSAPDDGLDDGSEWRVSGEIPGYVVLELSSLNVEGVAATTACMDPDQAEALADALRQIATEAREQ